MANLSNINNKFLVTTGGNVLIGQTAAVGTSIFQVTGSVNITGGTTSGLNITTSGTQDTININRAASNDNAITKYQTASADKWIVGLRNTSDDNFRFYSYGTSTDVLTINQGNGSATFAGTVIGTTARFDTLNNSANSKNLIYRNSSGAKTVVGGGPTPDKIYILDGGNVGIGASLPGAKLDVVGSGKFQPGIADGDALVTIAQTNTNAYVHAGIKINAGNTNPFYIYQSGSSNTLRFNYNSLADAGGQLVITDSGNVGIGTTSPDSLLTVSGSSLQNSNNAGIELSNSHNAQTVLLIENTTSRKYEVAVGGSANSIGNGSFYIYDGTAGAARLVIDSSGNVGIGTNSPGAKLEIAETAASTDCIVRIKATRDAYLQFSPANTTKWGLIADYPALGDFTMYNYPNNFNAIVCKDNKDITTNLSGGSFGIGTTSPEDKLHVSGGNVRIYSTNNANHLILKNNATATSGVFEERIKFLGWNDNENAAIIGMGNAYFGSPVNALAFQVSGAEAMRIKDGGNVGIGTTSPNSKLNVYDATADTSINVNTGTGGSYPKKTGISFGATSTSLGGDAKFTGGAGIQALNTAASGNPTDLTFWTNSTGTPAERMRITSGGDVLVAKTSQGLSIVGIEAAANATLRATKNNSSPVEFNRLGTDGDIVLFYKATAAKGSISITSSAVSYNTSSDYRLKEDLQDFAGLDMVSKIPVYDFKWKDNESRSYGVMAHELQEVLPQAVNGEKDAEEMQSVDYSKIVPLLVKSIQELKAEVEELKK